MRIFSPQCKKMTKNKILDIVIGKFKIIYEYEITVLSEFELFIKYSRAILEIFESDSLFMSSNLSIF